MKDAHYKCEFCGHRFATEAKFLRHECKQMKRDREFRSQLGQTAWTMYKTWLNLQKRYTPNADAFLHSKFYTSFIKFAKFAKKTQIPDVNLYMQLMVSEGIPPVLWENDEFYSKYLIFLDRRLPPDRQAKITVETLLNIAEAAECDVSDVFEHIEPNELILLLRQRRLSPWLLLRSMKFKQYVATIASRSTEQYVALEQMINPDFWRKKSKQHPEVVDTMRKYVQELGL